MAEYDERAPLLNERCIDDEERTLAAPPEPVVPPVPWPSLIGEYLITLRLSFDKRFQRYGRSTRSLASLSRLSTRSSTRQGLPCSTARAANAPT